MRLATILTLTAVNIGIAVTASRCGAQETVGAAAEVGVLVLDQRACQGYTLIAPMTASDTYLLDMQGRVVRTWHSDWQPGLSAYLLENGNLLRAATLLDDGRPLGGPGAGGRIQEFTWDGELIWDYKFPVDHRLPHHDIAPLPNGNVLVVAWDMRTAAEATAAGRREELVRGRPVLSDCVLEIKPTGKTTGEIVWVWNIWDHLVQDHDQTKANFGDVAAHPELIDVNVTEQMFGNLRIHPDGTTRLQMPAAFPELEHGQAGPGDLLDATTDWTHINFVSYHPVLDQIILSVRSFSEIWVIDHGTTIAEAAGHVGGRYGKGGDLLYRWGNPSAHRAGTTADQRLFKQHHADWIPSGHPGEGRILLFNNGNNRPDGQYSTVDEIALPLGIDGRYSPMLVSALKPVQAEWTYAARNRTDFFSMVVGGAQRLPNGNTLICAGASGTLIEVTPQQEVVWKYVNPVHGSLRGYRPPPSGINDVGRGGLPAVNNALFRAHRYAPDYPGLRGKHLAPGKLLQDVAVGARQERG